MASTQQQYEVFRENWRPTQEKVDAAIRKAVEISNPSRVFLFGSWPRGEATIDSDVDLAVFLPDDRASEIAALRRKIRAGFDGIPMSIDLIMASEGQVAEFVGSVNSIYSKIVRSGRLVYDSHARQAS